TSQPDSVLSKCRRSRHPIPTQIATAPHKGTMDSDFCQNERSMVDSQQADDHRLCMSLPRDAHLMEPLILVPDPARQSAEAGRRLVLSSAQLPTFCRRQWHHRRSRVALKDTARLALFNLGGQGQTRVSEGNKEPEA